MITACHHDEDYFQCIQKNYAHLFSDENFIIKITQAITQYDEKNLRFGLISSHEDWKELGLFRIKYYTHKKSYMLGEINENGLDENDDLGNVYAAWYNNNMIASIRLCSYPFESNSFLHEDTLKLFLGVNYKNEYLEWTRLLIQPHHPFPGLLAALITYAGIKTLAKQSYYKYFGYSTPIVKRLFSRFQLATTSLEFTIPKRGNHPYHLLKGDFALDFVNMLAKTSRDKL